VHCDACEHLSGLPACLPACLLARQYVLLACLPISASCPTASALAKQQLCHLCLPRNYTLPVVMGAWLERSPPLSLC